MEKRFNSASEIRENLNSFSVTPLLFARVLGVDYKKTTAPVSLMLSELHAIFPRGQIAAGEQEFVIIFYHSQRPHSTEIEDNIPLRGFLEKYDAHLGFSCAARDLTILPNQCRIAKQIVTLAKHLNLEPGERIYRHERYSVYCIIDCFAQYYCSLQGNNDIILLIHPAVVNLTRYDQLHNNNLRDIFHEYLLSDCSVSKTAAKTYMHRNTIMNKLKKITEMINVDLDDCIVCQQLLFSCQVILYYERVMGLQISP
jgi:DNA-binding PucR family transcriptional regulator